MTRAEDLASDREWIARRMFVELADTLAPDYDLETSLDRLARECVRLLDVPGASVLLFPAMEGAQGLAAGSPEQLRALAQLELDQAEGPGMDCFRLGEPVWCPELPTLNGDGRWPAYLPAVLSHGYLAAHALPLRHRDNTIGAINLFGHTTGHLDADTVHLGQALADVATLGILHYRALHERQLVVEQLQNALDSRIVIEQAKGILSERLGITVTEAFTVLRGHARSHRVKLSAVARGVIDGAVDMPPPGR